MEYVPAAKVACLLRQRGEPMFGFDLLISFRENCEERFTGFSSAKSPNTRNCVEQFIGSPRAKIKFFRRGKQWQSKRKSESILRAVHKYKDSREQFETRTHKRLIDILKPSNKTVEALMSLQLPAGVDIEIKL